MAACAYVTFDWLLRGQLVHHFVDNEAAKAGLDGLNAHLTEGFTPEEIGVVARWLGSLQTKFPKGEC